MTIFQVVLGIKRVVLVMN